MGKKHKNIRNVILILAGAVIVILGAGYKWSERHVYYYNAGQPHPINCASCHVYPQRDGFLAEFLNEDYLSPVNVAISKDQKTLYVTAQEGNKLVVVDLESQTVKKTIDVGLFPHSILLHPDEELGYVTNQWSNSISVIDLINLEIIDTLGTGYGPSGMSIDQEGKFLYVTNTYSSNLSIIDLESGEEIRRLNTGNNPMGAAVSPDGNSVFVCSRRTIPIPFRTPPKTELTVANTKTQRVDDRKFFVSAHIMENIAITPSGDLTIVTLVRPKNLVPSTQIERGWMMNQGIGIIENNNEGRLSQFILDDPNAYYPDPFDIVISNDGKRGYISHSGVDKITVIDIDAIREILATASEEDLKLFSNHLGISDQFVITRISTGSSPKGMTLSSDGSILYVAERLEDRVSMTDTRSFDFIGNLDLGGPKKISVTRKGAKLFTNAGHTFQNQYSCYSCHPDGHEDGLTYDLTGQGRNLANVQTLRDLSGTAPFKWIGTNVSVYMQCGMRFSKFVTRTEAFAPDDLDAVVAYIMRDLTHPPNPFQDLEGELTPAQLRGKVIYERTTTNDGREIPVENQCITCHPPPNFTNLLAADVGTKKEIDDYYLFDSPNLNNVYESAPYLHDGSAATLEEIWTKFNDHDLHGVANDMTKNQLNDMIEYLKSFGAAHTYTNMKTKEAKYENSSEKY